MEAARGQRGRTRSILTGIAAEGCLGDFLVWGFIWRFILPFAGALVLLVITEPVLFSFSLAFVVGVVVLIVGAVFVVPLTTTAGYLSAKQAALEREMCYEADPPADSR